MPIDSARGVLRAGELHVLHLQWLVAGQTQMRQAWYRCRELLDGRPARAINEYYSTTLPDPRVRTPRHRGIHARPASQPIPFD